MKEKLPRVSPDKIIKALIKLGFSEVRQSGSHKIFKNESGIRITVPYHSGKTIHPKVLREILNSLEITIEDLKKLF
ncbi:MAG: type II toxin-antitoxin system HicA family toxin [Candidatus Methanofastidiosum sp.]|nr:type II toxin-antitoxin system HicA family toxin [Methanofastidiosum sp.]